MQTLAELNAMPLATLKALLWAAMAEQDQHPDNDAALETVVVLNKVYNRRKPSGERTIKNFRNILFFTCNCK